MSGTDSDLGEVSEQQEPSEGPAGGGEASGRFARWRTRRRTRRAAWSPLRRRLTRGGEALVLLLVAIVGAFAGYSYYELHRIARINVNVSAVPSSGAGAGADNILLVGSTSRCAVQPAKHFENFVKQCEQGVNGVNSDVIMILHLAPGKTPSLLSIPRDTFVPNARSGGLYNKIDAALANGPNQLIAAIREDFGIPINHYVVLNFQGFAEIVHALGGITMYFPTSLYDKQSGLYISHSGCLHISGLEALALVRARHLQYHYDKKTKSWLGYDGSGDLGRIERVHVFLKVLAHQVSARGVGNPITDEQLLSSVAPYLTVDSTLTDHAMLSMILAYHARVADAAELTLPILEDPSTYYYKGYNYGDVVFPTEPQDQQTIDTFLGVRRPGEKLSPSKITVSVVDAAASPAEAASAVAGLRALGYDVSSGGALAPVGPVSETTVRYASEKTLVAAQKVASSLVGPVVLARGPTYGGAEVSVLTGSQLSVAVPTASALSATNAPRGAPVVALLLSALLGGPSAQANLLGASLSPLAPPTAAKAAKIPPYDPRACPGH